MKLVVVTAGLSQPSSTRLLADRLAQAVQERVEVEVRVVEVRDLATDIANHMVVGFPGAKLREVQEAVSAADALIAVSPIFTASYSGLFKSFFDVMDNEALIGKPVLIGATGGTARHSLALEHALRPMFVYLRALVMPTAVYAASEDFGHAGLAERITRAADELAGQLASRPAPARVEGLERVEDEVIPFAEQLAALRP